jgi:hypothetical protein
VWSDPKRSYFRPGSHDFGWHMCDIVISFLTFIALCFDLSGETDPETGKFVANTPPDSSESARPYKMVQAFKLVSLVPRIHVTKVTPAPAPTPAPTPALTPNPNPNPNPYPNPNPNPNPNPDPNPDHCA